MNTAPENAPRDAPESRVIHGDCLAVLPTLEPGSARLVIADPPYFNVLRGEGWDTAWENEVEYLAWTVDWIGACMQVLVPGGLLYCFGQVGKREHAMLHLMSEAAQRWSFHDLLVWDRAVGYPERCDSWTPAYEMALVLRKEGALPYFDKSAVRERYSKKIIAQYTQDKRYKDKEARRRHLSKGKFATNLWRIPSLKGRSGEKVGHPSQKPIALIERIVKACSAPGDLVIDPFLGSGTTASVCAKLSRRCLGIEKDAEYVQMARARLRAATSSVES